MVYMKSFALLSACVIGLFGKQVEQISFFCKVKDRPNYSLVQRESHYLVGPGINEKTEIFGKQTAPTDMSRFIDRLKCRVMGDAEWHYSDQNGQEFFYVCRQERMFNPSFSAAMQAKRNVVDQQYSWIDRFQRLLSANVATYRSIG